MPPASKGPPLHLLVNLYPEGVEQSQRLIHCGLPLLWPACILCCSGDLALAGASVLLASEGQPLSLLTDLYLGSDQHCDWLLFTWLCFDQSSPLLPAQVV